MYRAVQGPGTLGGVVHETEHLAEALARQAHEIDPRASNEETLSTLAAMVAHPEYPCLGARSVFRRDGVTSVTLDELGDAESVRVLGHALAEYGSTADPAGPFQSFIATFRGPEIDDERAFEKLLWETLQQLHDHDDADWASGVGTDPEAAHFAFSYAGVAYFVVGLHPKASRIARRAPVPTLVFNLHEQFELLRDQGGFDRMRDTIRTRDEALQGSVNPMADDHGDTSEARQYSGRAVEPDWHAPFVPQEPR